MLRQAVESFEPRTPLRDEAGELSGTFGEATATVRGEHEAIAANADVGYYAGRATELANDLTAVGAPADLVDDARDGAFEGEQAQLARDAKAPKADTAPDAPPAAPSERALGRGGSPAGMFPPKANPNVPPAPPSTPPAG